MDRAPILIVTDTFNVGTGIRRDTVVAAAIFRGNSDITKQIAGRILQKDCVEGWAEIARIEAEAKKHGHPVTIESIEERERSYRHWSELARAENKIVARYGPGVEVFFATPAPKTEPSRMAKKSLGFGGDLWRVKRDGQPEAIVTLWSSGGVPDGWAGHFPINATVERLSSFETRAWYADSKTANPSDERGPVQDRPASSPMGSGHFSEEPAK